MMQTANQIAARPRTPEEVERVVRQYREAAECSPWGRHAHRLLMLETPAYILHEDGRLERRPPSPTIQFAIDRHAEYMREVARQLGLEVEPRD
jgi:hypothetical protein